MRLRRTAKRVKCRSASHRDLSAPASTDLSLLTMSPAAIRGIPAMVWAGALSAAAITAAASGPAAHAVTVAHLPAGGLQPQAVVDGGGKVHVVYVTGAAEASDISYIQSADGEHFSNPVPVNSTP